MANSCSFLFQKLNVHPESSSSLLHSWCSFLSNSVNRWCLESLKRRLFRGKDTHLLGAWCEVSEVTKRLFWDLTSDRVAGIKGYSEKDINKCCPDPLAMIVLSLGPHPSLLQPLISRWVQGHWPVVWRLHLHFTLHFTSREFFRPSMATSLTEGYQALAVYFCSARNWRKIVLLAVNTLKVRCWPMCVH